MNEPRHSYSTPLSLKRYFWSLVLLWTAAVALILIIEVRDELQQAREITQRVADVVEKHPALEVEIRTPSTDAFYRVLGYGAIWLLGTGGIGYGINHLGQEILRRHHAEQRLQEAHDLLEQRVAERTAELAQANQALEAEIADRKRAERWLLESEERFRSCFELGQVGMAIVSPNKHWMEVNQRLGQLLGYREEDLLERPWTEVTYPEDVAVEEAKWEQVLAGNASGYSMDKRFVNREGQAVSVSIAVKGLRLADGSLDSLLLVVQNTTAPKNVS
jgi:PAS domain S-box-containing protein